MRWTGLFAFGAALLSALAVTPASAVDFSKSAAEYGPEGAWTSRCEIDRMTDTKVCRLMNYRLFDDGKEVGFVALSVIPTGNDYHLFLTTSQGMIDNCAIRVDRQPRIETQIATLNMCMFPNFVDRKSVV